MEPAISTLQKRLGRYLLLAVLVVASPFLIVMVMIMITGSRETGMGYGILPGLLLPQLIFGLVFIPRPNAQRLMWTLIGTLLAAGLFWAMMKVRLLATGWDLYGYWDLVLTSLIASIVAWELVHQLRGSFLKPGA